MRPLPKGVRHPGLHREQAAPEVDQTLVEARGARGLATKWIHLRYPPLVRREAQWHARNTKCSRSSWYPASRAYRMNGRAPTEGYIYFLPFVKYLAGRIRDWGLPLWLMKPLQKTL